MLLPAVGKFFSLLGFFFCSQVTFFHILVRLFWPLVLQFPLAHFPLPPPLPSVTQVRSLLFCVIFFCSPVTFFPIRFRFFSPSDSVFLFSLCYLFLYILLSS